MFSGRGTILTLMDESVSSEFSGFPFGIMEYYSDKCSDDGNLLLFMSDLQVTSFLNNTEPGDTYFDDR